MSFLEYSPPPSVATWLDCKHCKGSGKDPKKRTRKCSDCYDGKKGFYCVKCGEKFPCSGTVMDMQVIGFKIDKHCTYGDSEEKSTKGVIKEARDLAIQQLKDSGGGMWFTKKNFHDIEEFEGTNDHGSGLVRFFRCTKCGLENRNKHRIESEKCDA